MVLQITTYIEILILVILTLIGSYLLLINIIQWKKTESDIIRAKAFLDRSFLKRQFVIILITGIIAIFHIIEEPLELMGIVNGGFVWNFFVEAGHIIIMLNLVLLAYGWYRIMRKTK